MKEDEGVKKVETVSQFGMLIGYRWTGSAFPVSGIRESLPLDSNDPPQLRQYSIGLWGVKLPYRITLTYGCFSTCEMEKIDPSRSSL